MDGDRKMPESYAPYVFADSNPVVFSDPTGRFTLVEITSVQMHQGTLRQAFRQFATNEFKQQIRSQIESAVEDFIGQTLLSYIPGGSLVHEFVRLAGGDFSEAGRKFEKEVQDDSVRVGGVNLYFRPGVNEDTGQITFPGTPISDLQSGITRNPREMRGQRRPDYMISTDAMDVLKSGGGKSWVIGDLKLSASTMLNTYRGDDGQLKAIANNARNHSNTKVALWIVAGIRGAGKRVHTSDKGVIKAIRNLMQKRGLDSGYIPLILSF